MLALLWLFYFLVKLFINKSLQYIFINAFSVYRVRKKDHAVIAAAWVLCFSKLFAFQKSVTFDLKSMLSKLYRHTSRSETMIRGIINELDGAVAKIKIMFSAIKCSVCLTHRFEWAKPKWLILHVFALRVPVRRSYVRLIHTQVPSRRLDTAGSFHQETWEQAASVCRTQITSASQCGWDSNRCAHWGYSDTETCPPCSLYVLAYHKTAGSQSPQALLFILFTVVPTNTLHWLSSFVIADYVWDFSHRGSTHSPVLKFLPVDADSSLVALGDTHLVSAAPNLLTGVLGGVYIWGKPENDGQTVESSLHYFFSYPSF